ncbi:MSHA biogenesis protein MshN [Colwellia sp. E2M01]|uniref:tetratricopeptide repeat protein n=1 Tax=Colwellia sp. E2M01 TaxID=2841561 RepID=UPI001C0869A2|nr:MSHA biogenesis protein MshN [Colwellia sp. E2M01]MBU2870309.1 MSHA biogenesis protein MshN [Colwellia sp. E2M01]
MSVINQMLKDLDKRDSESNKHNALQNNSRMGLSTTNVALITGFGVLFLCLLGFYIWQLIAENNTLKAEKKHIQQANAQSESVQKNASSALAINNSQSNMEKPSQLKALKTSISSNQDKPITPQKAVNQVLVTEATTKSEATPIQTKVAQEENKKTVAAKPVTASKKANERQHSHSHSDEEGSRSHDVTPVVNKPAANKMSVSRRNLSADELVAKKLVLAEKALEAKQVDKAEKLLEDVIILKPTDSQTRKKLAALWFGRQAYQNATNLLSQGIALDAKDSSLREMKARIHLQQQQVTAALNTLKPLAQLKNEQYQIMLANTAQQAQQNQIAIMAYKTLISMQPEKGRWHLAIAVLYDKNSQFRLANESYNNALAKNDLSVSSEDFVKQRILAIGQ